MDNLVCALGNTCQFAVQIEPSSTTNSNWEIANIRRTGGTQASVSKSADRRSIEVRSGTLSGYVFFDIRIPGGLCEAGDYIKSDIMITIGEPSIAPPPINDCVPPCPSGQICVNGACVSENPCEGIQCPQGETCVNGICMPTGSCVSVTHIEGVPTSVDVGAGTTFMLGSMISVRPPNASNRSPVRWSLGLYPSSSSLTPSGITVNSDGTVVIIPDDDTPSYFYVRATIPNGRCGQDFSTAFQINLENIMIIEKTCTGVFWENHSDNLDALALQREWVDVCHNPLNPQTAFIAVGGRGTDSSNHTASQVGLMTSPNGVVWNSKSTIGDNPQLGIVTVGTFSTVVGDKNLIIAAAGHSTSIASNGRNRIFWRAIDGATIGNQWNLAAGTSPNLTSGWSTNYIWRGFAWGRHDNKNVCLVVGRNVSNGNGPMVYINDVTLDSNGAVTNLIFSPHARTDNIFWSDVCSGKDINGNQVFVSVGNSGWIAVHTTANTQQAMTNTSNSHLGSMMRFESPAVTWRAVAYAEDKNIFAAVGDSGTLMTFEVLPSPFGMPTDSTLRTIQRVSLGSTSWRNVVYDNINKVFIAMAHNGRTAICPDREDWVTLEHNHAGVWHGLATGNGTTVAVGFQTPGSNVRGRVITTGNS